MKIGFVLKGYPRVSETFIAQEIHLLEKQGFEIEIYSMRGPRESLRQPIIAKIKAPVIYLPEYIWPQFGSILRENFKALRRAPFRYLPTLIRAVVASLRRRDDDPIKRCLQAGWLVGHRALNAKSPVGHLHAHFAHAPAELAWYAAKLSGLKYSISAHAKDIYTIAQRDLIQRVRDCETIMTCTAYNAEFLKTLPGVDPAKVHLVYHGLDLKAFTPQTRADWNAEGLAKLLSVGRLVEKKGYEDIFMALKVLRDRGRKFTYDIYGAGDRLKSLTELRDHLGLAQQIHFHEAAVQPQIISRMQEGGVFLCGSRVSADGDRDGIPNTVAEAMAMKLPVVATDVSGIPELVESGVNGLLVPECRPDIMAHAIEALLNEPHLAQRLGDQARLKVEQVFNSSSLINECARILKPFTERPEHA